MSGDWDETTSIAAAPAEQYLEESEQETAYLIVIAGSNVGEMHKLDGEVTVLGRGAEASIRLIDDGISRSHARIRVEGDRVVVEDMGSRNGTFCNGEKTTFHELQDGDKLQLGRTTILKFSYHDHLEENFQKQMLDSALRDGLTQAYNKRYFVDRLDSEIQFARRHQVNLGLILMDLDHFKAINDTHGHLAGDRVLADFAAAMHRSIRHEDVFARYGGEEFAIITRTIDREDVHRFAERLRKQTAGLKIEFEGKSIPLTVSIGIATVPENPARSPEELLQTADDALYQAKHAGRNKVVLSEANGENSIKETQKIEV
jgi:diguanylate cyclase (GGDEF)-like protein